MSAKRRLRHDRPRRRRGWSSPCAGGALLAAALLGLSATPLLAQDNNAKNAAVRDITFDNIKLNMKKEDPFKQDLVTPEIKKLHGQSVRLRGYILPSFQQSGITQFVLVRDNMECCFGPGAAIFDCVLVEMEKDRGTSYTVRPVTVEGVFKIQEFSGPDGRLLAIYHMDGKAVK